MKKKRQGGPPPDLLTSEMVATRLSISIRTVWRLVAAGRFPQPVRWNRKLVRWKTKDVEEYLDNIDRLVVPEAAA